MARRTRSTGRRTSGHSAGLSARTKLVWLSLMGVMTGLGGVLLALDTGHSPRVDGLAMPALVAAQPTTAQIEAVFNTRRPLDAARWRYVMIHHTGEHFGSAASITTDHQRQGLKGLGHHFVIGNGAGLDDGQLFVGFRWLDQHPGAHAVGPRAREFNEHAISVCLVGNLNRSNPTRAQMDRLAELVGALSRQLGIPPERVILQSDVAPVSDPGRRFPESMLRERLADSN